MATWATLYAQPPQSLLMAGTSQAEQQAEPVPSGCHSTAHSLRGQCMHVQHSRLIVPHLTMWSETESVPNLVQLDCSLHDHHPGVAQLAHHATHDHVEHLGQGMW